MKQKLDYYRALPYSRRAEGRYDEDGPPYWVVWIDELPGCKTDGATYWEAMLNLETAFDDYIIAMLEFGSRIPTPYKESRKHEVRDLKRDEIPYDYFFGVLEVNKDDKAARPKPETYIQSWVVDDRGTSVNTIPNQELEYVQGEARGRVTR